MTPAETDEQKQERLRKQRREIEADALPRLPMEEMRTCQSERLAAETTADTDTRLRQISAHQCERLAAETTPERDHRFYSK